MQKEVREVLSVLFMGFELGVEELGSKPSCVRWCPHTSRCVFLIYNSLRV